VPELSAKNDLRALVEAAVSKATANGWPVGELRGIAFFDPQRDAQLASLESFAATTAAIVHLPLVIDRFGTAAATRLVLQFVYEYFKRMDEPRFDEAAFEAVWQEFTAELADPDWTTRGVANVRNFTSKALHIELGDSVTIRGRNFDELAALGFGTPVLERLSADWSGFGASSFVLVTEDIAPKRPENVNHMNLGAIWTKAQRAVGALRLVGSGDLSIGQMWVIRADRFNVGMAGVSSTGVSIPAIGAQYTWTDEIAAACPSVFAELERLEKEGYGKSPGNLDLALRAFMATYDRWPSGWDSKLLDSITALEALLGSGTEIAFKLAFRVAALVASNDHERGALLEMVKGFYDTRSALVHGGRLKEKHQLRLAKIDELRSVVRRLLRAFVGFATSGGHGYDKPFFQEHLDAALVNPGEREKLRDALGLGR
jgi:hypothetical protein